MISRHFLSLCLFRILASGWKNGVGHPISRVQKAAERTEVLHLTLASAHPYHGYHVRSITSPQS